MTSTQRGTGRRWPTVVVVVLVAVIAAACGTDDNTTAGAPAAGAGAPRSGCASGTISGAGSTFVQTIVQQWIKDYGERCPGATVNYQGVGSGAGIQQLTAGTVDFAGSDVAMTPAEARAATAKVGTVVNIPWSAGGIAVEYRLDAVADLNLSADAVAGIFAGTITRWDDPAIAATNRGASLPDTAIQVVHRSDGSGTTAVFTAYLSAAAPSVWTLGSAKDVAWPTGQGVKGSDGVTAAVKQTDGSIGYAELSFAQGAGLATAKIENPAGEFVAPEPDAVAAALAEADVPDDLAVEVDYTPTAPAAYPISTVTFVIVPAAPGDQAKGQLLASFIRYALGPGQQSAARLAYAPLPAPLVERATAALDRIAP